MSYEYFPRVCWRLYTSFPENEIFSLVFTFTCALGELIHNLLYVV